MRFIPREEKFFDLFEELADRIEAGLRDGADLNTAAMAALTEAIRATAPVRFEGNNYEQAWADEARRRGLSNKVTTPAALADLVSDKNVGVFAAAGVFSRRELESRHHVQMEKYCTTVQIEAATAMRIATTMLLPACRRQQAEAAGSVAALAGLPGLDEATLRTQQAGAVRYASQVAELQTGIAALEKKLALAGTIGALAERAEYYCRTVLPAMAALRQAADGLEEASDRGRWPLPQYWEMMFVH